MKLRYSILFSLCLAIVGFTSSVQAANLVVFERLGQNDLVTLILQGIEEARDESGLGEDWVFAYVDTQYRDLDIEARQAAQRYLLSVIEANVQQNTSQPIEKIFFQGSAPSTFAEDSPNLYPEAARYYYQITWQPSRGQVVPSDFDPQQTVEQIKQLFSAKKQLAVFFNRRDWSALVADAFASYLKDDPGLEYIPVFADVPLQALSDQISGFGDDTAILAIGLAEYSVTEHAKLQTLYSNPMAPVFTIFSHRLNETLGGVVIDGKKMGRHMVAVAEGLETDFTQNKILAPRLNAQQLDQFGLNEDDLPAGVQVVNRQDTYSEREVIEMLSLALAIIILITLVYVVLSIRKGAALKQRTLEAESSRRAMDTFLSNMSHELRTPLNGIYGVLQILKGSSPQEQQMLNAGLTSTKALTAILNDILDYQKLTAGKVDIRPTWFSCRTFFEQCENLFKGSAASKHISLTFTNEAPAKIELYGDEQRLAQVVNNVLGNAIKFTDNGIINVRYGIEQGQLFIEVKDTGIGMSSEDVEAIFERFQQADSSRTKRYAGTGLGMAITKGLVDAMRGSIAIESELGHGTTVTIHLPIQTNLPFTSNGVSQAQDAVFNTQTTRVLFVEDNETNRLVSQEMLAECFARFDLATDGADAVKMFAADKYDIVITDISMPVMSGEELQQYMALHYPDIPVVALTGNVLEGQRNAYLAAGFAAVIPKPADKDTVLSCVNDLLSRPVSRSSRLA